MTTIVYCNSRYVQATSMAAFDNYAMVLQNMALGANNCNGIESYCIYWCLSVVDYYHATNDTAALATYQSNVDRNLEHANAIFGDMTTGLSFFGWDDRVGVLVIVNEASPVMLLCVGVDDWEESRGGGGGGILGATSRCAVCLARFAGAGFFNASTSESQWDFRFIVLRAWQDWADVMTAVGNTTAASHWKSYAATGAAAIRSALGPNWTSALGVHAAAESLNAPNFATPAEVTSILMTQLNDAVQICSLSNFNQVGGHL
jgi:alpha-L-rhamnosidase